MITGTSVDGGSAESQIDFGKKLLDQFKPKTIIIEESPLQVISQEPKFQDGLWYPEVNDSTYALSGEDFELFMTKSVIENEHYVIDKK